MLPQASIQRLCSGLYIPTRAIPWRHLKAPAGVAAPQSRNLVGGRGLSERSEFRSPNLRDRGKGTRRATPGRPWFWVLLPKQKDLVVRGRNPAHLSLSVILDISNRGSILLFSSPFFPFLPAPSHGAISRAPAGVAAPQSRNLVGGEDCLSEASSAALTFGTEAKAPEGPRPGANGFGSFCRNKRTSACGAETPQAPPPFCHPCMCSVIC